MNNNPCLYLKEVTTHSIELCRTSERPCHLVSLNHAFGVLRVVVKTEKLADFINDCQATFIAALPIKQYPGEAIATRKDGVWVIRYYIVKDNTLIMRGGLAEFKSKKKADAFVEEYNSHLTNLAA